MKGTPISEMLVAGVAFPLAVHSGASNGAPISHPAQHGRVIEFTAQVGAITSMSALVIKVQGTNDDLDGSPSWAALKESDGVTDLQFTEASLLAADDSVVVGSLDLTRLPYKHLRLAITTFTGTAIGLGITYRVHQLRSVPSATVDDLFYKKHGGPGAMKVA